MKRFVVFVVLGLVWVLLSPVVPEASADSLGMLPRWFWQNPVPQGNALFDMAFEPDGVSGWAVGAHGAFLTTDCKGALWHSHPTPPAGAVTYYSVAAPAAGIVWTTTAAGLYHSTDNGMSWESVSTSGWDPPSSGEGRFVRFRTSQLGWVATSSTSIYRTSDGGATWSRCVTPQLSGWDMRLFKDLGPVLVAKVGDDYGHQQTWFSEDDGATWTLSSLFIQPRDVAFATDSVGVAIHSSAFQRTTDGGLTWSTARSFGFGVGDDEEGPEACAIWFANADTGYVLTSGDFALRTTNRGVRWQRFEPEYLDRYGRPTSHHPTPRAVLTVGSRSYVFGAGGGIMFTDDGGLSFQSVTADFGDSIVGAWFASATAGLAIGSECALETSDGGATWMRTPLGSDASMRGLAMAGGRGWAVGHTRHEGVILRVTPRDSSYTRHDGAIHRTTPKDSSWQFEPQASTDTARHYFSDVWTNDGLTAWVVGDGDNADDPPYLLKTTDGGQSWRCIFVTNAPMSGIYRPRFRKIQIRPSGTGWAVARGPGCSCVMKTKDNGETWAVQRSAPEGGDDLCVLDDKTCIVASLHAGDYVPDPHVDLAITRDGGNDWRDIVVPVTHPQLIPSWFTLGSPGWHWGTLNDIMFTDAEHGYIACSGFLLATSDGGKTWNQVEGFAPSLEALAAVDCDVWAFGYGGAVLYNGGEHGDYTPPLTRTSVPGGWYATDADVYLVPTDKYGVAETWWAIAGASGREARRGIAVGSDAVDPGSYRRYTGPIRVVAEGITPISVFSKDLSGNVEQERTVLVRVDKSRPTIRSNARHIYAGLARVRIRATDSVSGVRSVSWRRDRGRIHTVRASAATITTITVRRAGWHTLKMWARDRAGHRSAKGSVRFLVKR